MIDQQLYPIQDWDDAYANASHIPNGLQYLDAWANDAAAFRLQQQALGKADLDISYGPKERNKFDLFHPKDESKGLVVFVHGGFWLMLDKSAWSHLAKGSLEAGYSVAMPSYTLCPQACISEIVTEIGTAIEAAAALVSGEIRLTGHSAGGHLVTSMLCADSPLSHKVLQRIVKTVSISGVHDLRPLLNTAMNEKLQLTSDQATALSPVLKSPAHLAPFTCWVGSDERPEFLRLNKLQAHIWQSFALPTDWVEESAKHHFNVVDGLMDQQHPLMQSLLA
ncbi:MAG: alpha/beta hydrolase [Oceanospirillaceae bacterium]